MIAIVDYGMGNLASVYKAMLYIGQEAMITSKPADLLKADAVILPGVGAISDAMHNLKKLGLDGALKEVAAVRKPLLGICLGMQMLFDTSEEAAGIYNMKENKVKEGPSDDTSVKGLGIFKGKVVKFKPDPSIKIPHMGWNKLEQTRSAFLTEGIYVYFVHSYYAKPDDSEIITSKAYHGGYFAASVEKDSVCATQFHPEKSGDAGIEILRRWVKDSERWLG
ncbi:MAG: imidazole glycerol phosphate synthase subunit HisH [Saccharofermentanales bacterium]